MVKKASPVPSAPRKVLGGTVNQTKMVNIGYHSKRSEMKSKETKSKNE